MLSIRFWGTRGSIACPGSATEEFGGNTTCMELRADERLVIVDMGSGIRGLGGYLMANDFTQGPVNADIFLTHTHLDHIIGFPVFAPLFISQNEFRIYGPVMSGGGGVREALDTLLSYPFWPVHISEFPAKLVFKNILETTIDLGNGLTASSIMLNHPVITLGYRFEYQGKAIVVATDTEPFWNMFADKNHPMYNAHADYEGRITAEAKNKKVTDFFKDADILIHDCSYTEAEYQSGKRNWGHTSYESAIKTAKISGVKKLAVFHHEPSRTDEALRKISEQLFNNDYGMEITVAKEKLVLTA
jgi:phosphoribosyl 1,2-cyclic phosphodiesterase